MLTAKCPIALLDLMKLQCTGVQQGVYPPLAYVKQICNVVNCYQHPCGGEILSSGDFKRTVESHIDTLFKAGGHFPLGTNMYMYHLNAQGMTLIQYLGLTADQQRVINQEVKDELTGVIMSKGVASKELIDYMAQQYIIPGNANPYPLGGNKMCQMIDSGKWKMDEKPPSRTKQQ